MKYLLDTNACIVYLNGRSLKVRQRLEAQQPADIALCSIVKSELFYGAMRSNNPARTLAQLQNFFRPFVSLPFDDRAAEIYGRVRAELSAQGALIGPYDLQIAAIAVSHGLTLITHNTGEFGRVRNLIYEDWE